MSARESANHICHMIQENESIHLSEKSRYDIYHTVRAVEDYWREDSDKIRKENHAKRWNELGIWIGENPMATVKDIETIMEMLDRGLYIRDCKVKK